MVILWSLLTAGTGLVQSFRVLWMVRFWFGIGEGNGSEAIDPNNLKLERGVSGFNRAHALAHRTAVFGRRKHANLQPGRTYSPGSVMRWTAGQSHGREVVLPNIANFRLPVRQIDSVNIARITSSDNGREMQFVLKFLF